MMACRPLSARLAATHTSSAPRARARSYKLQTVTAMAPAPQQAATVQAPTAELASTSTAPAPAPAAVASLALLQRPSSLQPRNLVPALSSTLASLHAAAATPGAVGVDAAATPALLGGLAAAAEVLDTPAGANLGAEAPLLLLEALEALSHGLVPGSAQEEQARNVWRRAHVALGEAADWRQLPPSAAVRYYESVARCTVAGLPSRSSALGKALREHLQNNRQSSEEGVRLLSAWATLRRRCGFNPDAYLFSDLSAQLVAAARGLSGAELQVVAAAAPAFEWPVYRSLPLMHAVSREAVHRSMSGALPTPVAQWVIAAAVKGAAAMRPRHALELEEAMGEWMRSAPKRSNNILKAVPTVLAPPAPSSAAQASAAAADKRP